MDDIFKKYAELFLGHVRTSEDCWVWAGAKAVRNQKFTPITYGCFVCNKPKVTRHYAHRFAWQLFRGPIPKGLHIDHLCRNTLCVNPAHLEPVTMAVNILRGDTIPARNAKKMKCPKGHPYSGDNLHIRKKGHLMVRECRECNRALGRRYYALNKEKWVARRLAKHANKP